MATFSIQAIKNNNKDNLSYGKSRDGKSVTLTGTVYDASYETKIRNGKVVETKDIGDKFFGVTLTVMIPQQNSEELIQAVQDFLDNNKEMGVTDPKVGLVFECRSLGKPVEGIHPVYGTKSLNVIVQNPTFVEVEQPPELFTSEDQLDDLTAEAAQIASDRSKESLLASMMRRLKLTEEGNAKTTAKQTKKK